MDNKKSVNSTPKVLVIPTKTVKTLYNQPGFYYDQKSIDTVLNAIERYGEFVNREWAENNDCVKQIVAYSIIRNNSKILCLRRSKKSSRKALRLRYTLLFGGHVDDVDERPYISVKSDNSKFSVNSLNTLNNCLLRELREEFGIVLKSNPILKGIAIDPTTSVGKLHLGIIFEVQSSTTEISVKSNLDNEEFINSTKDNVYNLVGWNYINKIADKFDPWSSLFLSSTATKIILKCPYSIIQQIPLPLKWT